MKKYIWPALLTIITIGLSSFIAEKATQTFGGPVYKTLPFAYKMGTCSLSVTPIACNQTYIWWGILLCILAWIVSFGLFAYFKKWGMRVILVIFMTLILTLASVLFTQIY